MIKQDIYDIIQLLEAHFESIEKEVQTELKFRFEQDVQSSFVDYDHEHLFTQSMEDEDGYYTGEEKVESVKDNLIILYPMPYFWVGNSVERLEEDAQNAEFNLKSFKYLSQEFKVLGFQNEGDEYHFTIQDSEFTGESKNPTKRKFRTDEIETLDDEYDFFTPVRPYDDDSDYEEIDEKVQLKKFNQFK